MFNLSVIEFEGFCWGVFGVGVGNEGRMSEWGLKFFFFFLVWVILFLLVLYCKFFEKKFWK